VRFALPTKKQVVKWALAALGTILLGALGSGLWQSLLGPTIHASTRWVLDLASLGLKSYKDGVYLQIAADNQSRAAVESLYLVTLGYVLVLVMVVVFIFGKLSELRGRTEHLLRGLSDTPEPDRTPNDMRQELETMLKSLRRLRLFLYVSSVFWCVMAVNHIVVEERLSYISSADTHYHQVLRLALPYLDEREQVQVESDFAQIGSREDYVRLLSRLEGHCKANGRTIPKFDPW
jgi:hypothetical protein